MTHLNDLARHSGNGSEFNLSFYYGTWTCAIKGKHEGVEIKVTKTGGDDGVENTPQSVYEVAAREFDRVTFSGAKELNPLLEFAGQVESEPYEAPPYSEVDADDDVPF